MVWSTTSRIGCGKIVYKKGKTLHKYLVCNYGAAGNILNAPMYKIGQACSACPFGCAGNGLCKAPGGRSNGPSSSSVIINPPPQSNSFLPQLPISLPSLPFANHLGPQSFPQVQNNLPSILPSGFGGRRPIQTSNIGPSPGDITITTTTTTNNRPLRPQNSGFIPFMDISNPFKRPNQGFLPPQSPFGGMIGLLNMPFNFGNIRFP
eukprot:TRINITY_DN1615_c0_g1_i3.p1 TRINITY_DN1615_c0_g1~~TRINITY_DN1615_c0_g1_i3.p1  ORF type:complete len:206 (+),score=42.81 TRINITY_DN1615_c0_g1_i3:534-1151(+)